MGPVSGGSHGGKPRRGSGAERMLRTDAFDPELLFVGDEEGRGEWSEEVNGKEKGKGVVVTGVYVEAEEGMGM